MAHCQICGREIKLVHGLIAHHGFTRPGIGWQTASCWGARELPYEVSRDKIPVVIRMLEKWVIENRQLMQSAMTTPPEQLTTPVRNGTKAVERPADFDPAACIARGSVIPGTYEAEFHRFYHDKRRQAEMMELEGKDLLRRWGEWKAPQ